MNIIFINDGNLWRAIILTEVYHLYETSSLLWNVKRFPKNMLKQVLYKSDWRLCAILNQYFLTPTGQCIYCYCLSMMVSDVESPLNTAWYMIINPKHCLVEMVAVSDFEKVKSCIQFDFVLSCLVTISQVNNCWPRVWLLLSMIPTGVLRSR